MSLTLIIEPMEYPKFVHGLASAITWVFHNQYLFYLKR
jgi:hypothetical protein